MENNLLQEKFNNIGKELERHNGRLNAHGRRLDKIEQENSTFRAEIKNLCENIKTLTITMRWFMGLLIASFVSFFFYAIQNNIFN